MIISLFKNSAWLEQFHISIESFKNICLVCGRGPNNLFLEDTILKKKLYGPFL